MPLPSEVVFVASSVPGPFSVLNGFAHTKQASAFPDPLSELALAHLLSSFQTVVDRTCLLSSSLFSVLVGFCHF